LSLLLKFYWLAALAVVTAIASFVAWSQVNVFTSDLGKLDVGRGVHAPPHTEVDGSPQWWAAVFALLADVTLLVSLIFGIVYLWLVAPEWPPTHVVDLGMWGFVAIVGSAMPLLLTRQAIAANAAGAPSTTLLAIMAASLLQLALLSNLLLRMDAPQSHAHQATSYALLLYSATHWVVCFAITFNTWLKARRGALSPARRVDFGVLRLWVDYTALSGVIAIGLLMLMPKLVGALP
jgi:cytochrome c oxidase subunit I+III